MKVRELIALLATQPQDVDVFIDMQGQGDHNYDIEEMEYTQGVGLKGSTPSYTEEGVRLYVEGREE